ncbi:MAG: hypothetical protein ACI8UO_001475 [Verrucomicrobiales bacterium]|jgi:hypothetical protein
MLSRSTFPALLALLCFPGFGISQDVPAAVMSGKHFALFEKYCLDCHDSATEKGEVDLERLSFDLGTLESAETWQKVLDSLNSGEMPPEDKKQPGAEEKTAFLETLSNQLVTARKLLSDSGGQITMRRLNRREYRNTIQQLLGVEIDVGELPDDANSGGFDTAGGSLFFSSDQFEQYLRIARQALDEAIVAGPKPKSRTLRRESEDGPRKRAKAISDKLRKAFERAQAWRESEGKEPSEFGFLDEDRVKFEERLFNQQHATYIRYLERPETETGVLLFNLFNGAMTDAVDFPKNAAPGNYVLRLRVAALDDVESSRRFLEFGHRPATALGGELEILGCRQVSGSIDAPQILEIPITITKSGDRSFAFRERQRNSRTATRSAFIRHQTKHGHGPDPALWIDWIEWEGPIVEQWPPASQSKLIKNGLTDQTARAVVEDFAKRAFRDKEPKTAFLDKLLELYRGRRAAGESPREAIKEPLSVILASPNFLYLSEPTGETEKRSLTNLELAVRLSYFLWSGPPDEELLSAELSEAKILRAQTARLLADPRASEFVSGFAHQWLHMERLDFFQFNFQLYPEFDESTKEAARNEVYETLHRLLRENLGLQQLLKSDEVVINDLLADYYEISGVEGEHFRAVQVPAGSPRGGLLGMAAVLAMGSDGERTSPVERGAWVMRKVLHDPPPPAPPNVPQLSRHAGKPLSSRGMLAAHMEEPQCAQCHRRIDPLGFGLENFDAAGRWRDQETVVTPGKTKRQTKTSQFPIDPSGTLPDGTAFADFFEFRDRIAEKDDAFAHGFVEALIEYGLGRPYGFSDYELANSILERAKNQDGRVRAFIHSLVQSSEFQTK